MDADVHPLVAGSRGYKITAAWGILGLAMMSESRVSWCSGVSWVTFQNVAVFMTSLPSDIHFVGPLL